MKALIVEQLKGPNEEQSECRENYSERDVIFELNKSIFSKLTETKPLILSVKYHRAANGSK